MARNKILDKGTEVLRQAGVDPVGGFLIRVMGPGVRRELSRLSSTVRGVIDDVSGALKEIEGEDVVDVEAQVIDAEVISEEKKRAK